ncbi:MULTISPECIES: hypothetical protein [unclassified Candidatus Tisiphia]|uniref:hypothetical protein n=1 Tax=unclassified Candidatus Tisiphia TaxID=2996318 RepID=UPI00312CAE2F
MQKSETNIIKGRSNNPIILTIILIVLFAISIGYMTFLNNKKVDTELPDNPTTSKPATISENVVLQKDSSLNQEEVLLNHQPKSSKPPPNYSIYLLSVNLLVINFLQDKDYTQQIRQIETVELPTKIKNILLDLHNYNENYLLNNSLGLVKIFPKANCWIEKFIKIERKSSFTKDKEKLKLRIIGNLDFFINFFYSEELQQKFVE